MSLFLTPIDRAKYAAARRAVDLVEDGMKLGLGTGSTAAWMIRALAERAREENLRLTCAATSNRSADLAAELGLKVVTLDQAGWLDLTIDGADEFDAELTLIKGGGGALAAREGADQRAFLRALRGSEGRREEFHNRLGVSAVVR